MVERGVGQHHAQLVRPGSDRTAATGAASRRRRARSVSGLRSAGRASSGQAPPTARPPRSRHHQREWLVLAVFSRPQRRHRPPVGCQARQVVAPDTLDGQDPTVAEGRRSGLHRIARPGHVDRPTGGSISDTAGPHTGQALGWAWNRRLEGSSYSARQSPHHEPRHGRERAVVRDPLHDRESRPAVGAVGERIAVAAIARIEHLAQAVVTRRGVGVTSASALPPRGLSTI